MTEKRKRRRGPYIKLTDEHFEKIERMAGLGLTHRQIAAAMNMSHDTLSRRKKDTAAVSEAMARGRAVAAAKVGKSLFEQALDGNVNAIKWYEMTRLNYRPTAPGTNGEDGEEDHVQALTINFETLPAVREIKITRGESAD